MHNCHNCQTCRTDVKIPYTEAPGCSFRRDTDVSGAVILMESSKCVKGASNSVAFMKERCAEG